jgi:hypothetical protein
MHGQPTEANRFQLPSPRTSMTTYALHQAWAKLETGCRSGTSGSLAEAIRGGRLPNHRASME